MYSLSYADHLAGSRGEQCPGFAAVLEAVRRHPSMRVVLDGQPLSGRRQPYMLGEFQCTREFQGKTAAN